MHSTTVALTALSALCASAQLDTTDPVEVQRSWPKVVVAHEPLAEDEVPLTKWVVVAEPMESVGEHVRAGVVRILDGELAPRWSVDGERADERLGVFLSRPVQLDDHLFVAYAAEHGGAGLSLRRLQFGDEGVSSTRRIVSIAPDGILAGPALLPNGRGEVLYHLHGGVVRRIELPLEGEPRISAVADDALFFQPTVIEVAADVTGDGVRDFVAFRERSGEHRDAAAVGAVLDGTRAIVVADLIVALAEPLWFTEDPRFARTFDEPAPFRLTKDRTTRLLDVRTADSAGDALLLVSAMTREATRVDGTPDAGETSPAIVVQVNLLRLPSLVGGTQAPDDRLPPRRHLEAACLDLEGGFPNYAYVQSWIPDDLRWNDPSLNWGAPVIGDFLPHVVVVDRWSSWIERGSTMAPPTFTGDTADWPRPEGERRAWIGGGAAARLVADGRSVVLFTSRGVPIRFDEHIDMLDEGGNAATGGEFEGTSLWVYDVDRASFVDRVPLSAPPRLPERTAETTGEDD